MATKSTLKTLPPDIQQLIANLRRDNRLLRTQKHHLRELVNDLSRRLGASKG